MGRTISETLRRFPIRIAAVIAAIIATAPLVLAEETAGETTSSAATEKPKGGAIAAESGVASVYASDLEGNLTASGERYDSQKLTAAHRSLPFGSRISVTDAAFGKTVTVVVNDRWAGGPGQIINLSRRAADVLGMQGPTQREVEIRVESLGDGRRQTPQSGGLTPQLLPVRVEATSNTPGSRARSCTNEAEILGLRDVLLEIHVHNCLGRKPKDTTASNQVKTKQ
jgi:rare lipoprotein A